MKRTLVHTSLADITDRRRLDHVTDGEALDSLVFGDASRAVRATNEVDVATAVLVAAVVSSLLGLCRTNEKDERSVEATFGRPSSRVRLCHPTPPRTTFPLSTTKTHPQDSDGPNVNINGILTMMGRVS